MSYKEYTVIEAPSIQELVIVVNRHLNDGWTLAGGVSQTVITYQYPDQRPSYQYLQALESVIHVSVR